MIFLINFRCFNQKLPVKSIRASYTWWCPSGTLVSYCQLLVLLPTFDLMCSHLEIFFSILYHCNFLIIRHFGNWLRFVIVFMYTDNSSAVILSWLFINSYSKIYIHKKEQSVVRHPVQLWLLFSVLLFFF